MPVGMTSSGLLGRGSRGRAGKIVFIRRLNAIRERKRRSGWQFYKWDVRFFVDVHRSPAIWNDG
jgi:hypothetical protein